MSEQESGSQKRQIPGWSIVMGAMLGAAAGFALCASLWGSPKHVKRSYRDESVAGLCLIAAVAIWRRHDREGSFKWRLLGGVGAAPVAVGLYWLLLGPKPGPALRTEQLPGFSIAVPQVEVEHRNDNYAFGVLHAQGPHRAFVEVLWVPGPLFDDADLLTGTKRILHDDFEWKDVHPIASQRSYQAGDLPVQSLELLARGNRYQMSIVQCGERVIMPITGGNSYGEVDLPALHRRVVASVRCTPDPLEERLVARPPPVVLDLPEGWRLAEDMGLVNEAFFIGPQGGAINAYVLLAGLDADGIAAGITYTVGEMSETEITWSTPLAAVAAIGGRDAWSGRLVDQGDPYEVVAVTAPCLSRTMVAIYVGEPDFAAARTALASARCE